MASQDHANILQEMRRTGTVRGSVEVFMRQFAHRMGRALQDHDTAALYELHSEIANHEPVIDAMAHGTSIAPMDRDVDPAAPGAATRSDVGTGEYGSEGPADTDTQRNTSAGYAGRDVQPNAPQPPSEPPANRAIPEQVEPRSTSAVKEPNRSGFNEAEQAAHDREFPDAGKTTSSSAQSATSVGEQRVDQDFRREADAPRSDRREPARQDS